MKNVMGVIYTGEKDSFLRELAFCGVSAAMPVAGRYQCDHDFLVGRQHGGQRHAQHGRHIMEELHNLMDTI